MTTAISVAAKHGAKAVICASTGNTSASAAAYATKAGMTCGVLVPEGKIAMGKLSQAIAHGATLLQVDGNFDDCLTLARKLAEAYPVELVNSVNPARIEGQKTASFEVVDALGDAPDIHCLPVGNAGNITAYWRGYREYAAGHGIAGVPDGVASRLPQMWGFQAAGAAPIVLGHPVDHPETIATAIRIGNPASWKQAEEARDESGGRIEAVTDEQILAAHRLLSSREGIFVEPGSAASVAGLLMAHEAGHVPAGATVVCTVTGHGLKDPQWALKNADGVRGRPDPGRRSTPSRRRRRWGWTADGGGGRPLAPGTAVQVRVPASSANLGPGLRLHRAGPRASGTSAPPPSPRSPDSSSRWRAAGAGEVPLDERHLVYRSMLTAWEHLARGGRRGGAGGPAPAVPQRGAPRPRPGLVGHGHRHGGRCGTGALGRLPR